MLCRADFLFLCVSFCIDHLSNPLKLLRPFAAEMRGLGQMVCEKNFKKKDQQWMKKTKSFNSMLNEASTATDSFLSIYTVPIPKIPHTPSAAYQKNVSLFLQPNHRNQSSLYRSSFFHSCALPTHLFHYQRSFVLMHTITGQNMALIFIRVCHW